MCCARGRTSLNIGLRVVLHDPGLKSVCGHRPLILLGRVGVPHDPPTTRPQREGCNSGTALVKGLQRLQSGHSGKAHWRPTRLDTKLRSARARGTLTSGGQAEKRQCFSRPNPARETEGNAPDAAKRQWRHGHFMQTRSYGVTHWRRETEAKYHRKGLERKRVDVSFPASSRTQRVFHKMPGVTFLAKHVKPRFCLAHLWDDMKLLLQIVKQVQLIFHRICARKEFSHKPMGPESCAHRNRTPLHQLTIVRPIWTVREQ